MNINNTLVDNVAITPLPVALPLSPDIPSVAKSSFIYTREDTTDDVILLDDNDTVMGSDPDPPQYNYL